MDDDVVITFLGDKQESSNTKPIQPDRNSTDALYEDGDNEPASIEIASESCEDEPPDDKEQDEDEEMAEITKTPTKNKPKGSSELDKFKRRLIRVIARLIRDDQTPTQEIWRELKKQTGCDCKLLWDRMRALTTKKLDRLIAAQDIIKNITHIAQLTVTDWLLFDLVLVHEDLDVISQGVIDPDNKESPKVLEDLFALVVIYNLENLEGDNLTKAWFEATKDYNGKERQCSPMLLQRRWYQMKSKVREKFYQFWFSYRGDQRQLAVANEYKPTDLEMEIVKHFKYITTRQFLTWEELIEQKKVALPEDFERLQLAKRRIFRTETGPDLEVIEPHVETIDLEQDTDSEESRDSVLVHEPKENVNQGIVKMENVDEISDDDDDVPVLESVQIPVQTNTHTVFESDVGDSNEMVVDEDISSVIDIEDDISFVDDDPCSIKSDQLPVVKNEHFAINQQDIDFTERQDIDDVSQAHVEMVMPRIVASTSIANISNEYDKVMTKISNVSSSAIVIDESADAVNLEINGILESVAENIKKKNSFSVLPTSIRPENNKKIKLSDNVDANLLVKNTDTEICYMLNNTSKADEKLDYNVIHSDINIFDGIELEDDGIEYIEEDDDMQDVQPKAITRTDDSDCGNSPTIDLKLLLTPLVYTKKLDNMDVFRFIDYTTVKDIRVIQNAENESKPVDRNSVKMEEISQQPLIDGDGCQPIPDNDAFSDSTSEYNSEDDLGPETISSSSWLFTKLKKISYNPIQLCKNPDFNTRLKRLSAGFFSSERNRCLLKECKPLTIDLHKSFEAKLHNNTLYLSGTKSIGNKSVSLEENEMGNTVLPTTAMPMENFNNNAVNDNLGLFPSMNSLPQSNHHVLMESHVAERKKVINLPDIAQIRRLNEKLLTAEVTPIQVSNSSKPPVNIVPTQPNVQNINKLRNNTTDDVKKGTDSTMSTYTVLLGNNSNKNNNLSSNAPSEISQTKLSNTSAGVVKNSVNAYLPSNNSLINTTKKIESLEFPTSKYQVKVPNGRLLNSRFNNQQFIKSSKEPKKGIRLNNAIVPWNTKAKKFSVPRDVLLTSDTVDKILKVCRGETEVLSRNTTSQSKINKALRKQALKKEKKEESALSKLKNQNKCEESFNEVSNVSEQEPIENVCNDKVHNTVKNKTANATKQNNPVRIDKRTKYCCWAREKIVKLLLKKRSVKRHDCPRPLCNCCCRQELVDKMFELRLMSDRTIQPEKEQNVHPIEITVSSTQNRYQSLTQKNQTIRNTTQIPRNTSNITSQLSFKVSVGINTDFDMEFEKSFADNLAELNASSKFFNDDSLSSSINVTYAPNINQANGQTQTFVNLMILGKHSRTQNYETVSDNSNVKPIENPALSNKTYSTDDTIKSSSTNIISKESATVSDENNSNPLKQTKPSTIIPKILVASEKNSPILSINHRNSRNQRRSNPNNIAVGSYKSNPILHSSESTIQNAIAKNSFLILDKTKSKYQCPPKIAPKIPASMARDKMSTSSLMPLYCNTSSVVLQEKAGKSGKILFLTHDRSSDSYSRTPICLGKNKILLCSFEKSHLKSQPQIDDRSNIANTSNTDSIQSTIPHLALPDGVRIVLLPNKELALSIDPGVELDSSQLSYLPTLMASIQQQLAEADNSTPSSLDPLKTKDASTNQNNVTIINESQFGDSKKDDYDNLNALSCSKQLKDPSDEVMEVDTYNDKEAGKHENSNSSEVALKDNSDLNKKTILSDLMEMSGISAEDTHITNNVSPTKQMSELCPRPIFEGLQSQNANKNKEQFINNPLFQNPAVQAALNICSELCVVFSYQELRYASENNAQFFKIDIETGVIVPINLVIKKQITRRSSQPYALSKSVIDLTDDYDEGETLNIKENSPGTFEIEPPVGREGNRAIPVKLFSSIHPSILRRGKSLQVNSVSSNSYPQAQPNIKSKKLIRVIQVKHKRKQNMDCVASIDLDSDNEANEDNISLGVNSDDDSDSDNEPLAFKAKRNKVTLEPDEPSETIIQLTEKVGNQVETLDPHNEIDNEIVITEEVVETTTVDEIPKNVGDEAINSAPELELSNVEFETLNFHENVPQSSDEDCILGV